jgi:hypothetical protein
MQNYTIWEWFNRDHRGWLVSRFWRGKHVLKRDIKRVLENDPDALSEPIVVALLEALQNGTLARKRGRSKFSLAEMTRLIFIEIELRDLADRIRWFRNKRPAGARKVRGEYSPRDLAANEMAKRFGYSSRHVLLNRISAQRKRYPLFL